MEAWGSRGSPQPQPARKVPLSVNPLGGHRKTCQRFRRPQGWVTSGQTTNREGVQPHPSADNWIKALLSKTLPCRARPSFSHHQSLPSGILHKPLSFLHQGADRSSKSHDPTVVERKTILQKVNQDEKQSYVPEEGTIQNPRKPN